MMFSIICQCLLHHELLTLDGWSNKEAKMEDSVKPFPPYSSQSTSTLHQKIMSGLPDRQSSEHHNPIEASSHWPANKTLLLWVWMDPSDVCLQGGKSQGREEAAPGARNQHPLQGFL